MVLKIRHSPLAEALLVLSRNTSHLTGDTLYTDCCGRVLWMVWFWFSTTAACNCWLMPSLWSAIVPKCSSESSFSCWIFSVLYL